MGTITAQTFQPGWKPRLPWRRFMVSKPLPNRPAAMGCLQLHHRLGAEMAKRAWQDSGQVGTEWFFPTIRNANPACRLEGEESVLQYGL